MVIGCKSGQTYAYTIEFGMEAKKEYCKAMREAHAEAKLAGTHLKSSLMRPYALPKTIEMEMLARGYNLKEAEQNGQIKEIANVVAKEYPEFLCTSYTTFNIKRFQCK